MIFIDTGAFISRYLCADQFHEKSLAKWEEVQARHYKCFTSNFVLDETFTLLGRWADNEFACQKAEMIYTSNAIDVLRPDHEDELLALEYMLKYADQKISFTDCISFVLMKKKKIKRVFTCDRHFELPGFTAL